MSAMGRTDAFAALTETAGCAIRRSTSAWAVPKKVEKRQSPNASRSSRKREVDSRITQSLFAELRTARMNERSLSPARRR
jgi:hypothetical protein